MSETKTSTSTDLLRSLRMIRSAAPDERRTGIAVLSAVSDDPRVTQVFEHLYQNDPDPSVREAAWRALRRSGPSVPAPGPALAAPSGHNPAPGARPRTAGTPASRPSSGRALFLLNPANAAFVAREMKRIESQKKRGRTPLWLAVMALLVVGMMWAYILDVDDPDDHLVITAAALSIAVIALLLLGLIRRRGGLRTRRMLRGQIVECTGRLDEDGDFKIKVDYRVRTPADKVLSGQGRLIRNDLRQKPLPTPGTPVAVYYRSDRSHRLL
jgi:hypothetical protein